MRRETERWRGISALALLPFGVGVVLREPGILLLGIVGIGYAAYAANTTPPEVDVTIERDIDEPDPDPGEEVAVTLSITNDGPLLADLRIVDGVPPALETTEGSPRLATALRSGKTAHLSYTVEARRGRHEFEPVFLVARNASSSVERETTVAVDSTVTCVPTLSSPAKLPLRGKTDTRVGRLTTGSGGAGVEFFAVREYRPGDSLSRIDWRRLAKTGDLATVEFHEERAASVAMVLDGRREAYVGDGQDTSAMEYQVEAAGAVAQALLDAGDQVGLAGFGPRWTWVPPGLGRDQRARLRNELALAEAFSPVPPEERFLPGLSLRRIRKHLPASAQAVFLTPLSDDAVVRSIERTEAFGHPVTVISPDLTATDTPGRRLATMERRLRIRQLRERGIRVVDWDVARPVAVAVAEAARRWPS